MHYVKYIYHEYFAVTQIFWVSSFSVRLEGTSNEIFPFY